MVEICKCQMRIEYMYNDYCYTDIWVDFKNEEIFIENSTDDIMMNAFGAIEKPSWEDFQYFLRERCIPEGRFQIKQVLRDIGLSSYDPIQILEITEGRIGEDDRWLRITHLS